MGLFSRKKEISLCYLSFLQALATAIYCLVIGLFFTNAECWFGKMTSFWGPFLLLVLFVTSALICGLLVFGYPIYLFWEKKKTEEALRLVAYTTGWLLGFAFLIMLILASL